MRVLAYSVARDSASLPRPRFRRGQDALGIHALKNLFEAGALFAAADFDRDFEIREEQRVGVHDLAAHFSLS